MIISRDYIRNKFVCLVEEKQQKLENQKIEEIKYYRIKQMFSKWLRNIIFNPFNAFYSVFLQYNVTNKNFKNKANLVPLHPLSVDFVNYWLNNNINFDTSNYYSETDLSLITSMIKNRLKSIILGCNAIALSEEQLGMSRKKEELLKNVKKSS